MPDMNMYGKVSPDEYPFTDKYRFWIGQEDGEDYVSFDRGMGALSDAIVLWSLIDPERRQEIESYIKTEIEQEWNLFWEHKYPGGYRVTVEQIKRLLEMIDDVDLKADKLVDADGKVLPQHYDFVVKTFGPLTAEAGFQKELSNVYWLKAFMRKAVELNYELAFG